jgi:hypothetical protein
VDSCLVQAREEEEKEEEEEEEEKYHLARLMHHIQLGF